MERGIGAVLTLVAVFFATGTALRTFTPGEPVIALLQSCGDYPMSVVGSDGRVIFVDSTK